MLLCATTIVSFTFCSKDNEENTFDPSIVGTWSRTYESTSGYVTVTVEQTETFYKNLTATGTINTYLNGSLMHSRDDFRWTYTYNGITLKMTNVSDGSVQTFNASIKGNTLTMIGDEGTLVFTRK